jgi:hypothetical protein
MYPLAIMENGSSVSLKRQPLEETIVSLVRRNSEKAIVA